MANITSSNSAEFSVIMKAKLLDILKFTLYFCDKHNLRCYGCGGTVLGAVRHKGFIPWDDDVDLYMPREDYDRLMKMNCELNKSGYSFVCFETDTNYYLPFGKIIDNRTSMWEYKYYPYMIGNYVDIFPLDYFDESNETITSIQEKYHKIFQEYQTTLKRRSIVEILYSLKHAQFKRTIQQIYYGQRDSSKQKYYNELMSYINFFRESIGSKCVCVPTWQGRIFEASWFEESIEFPFEDIKILIPKEYDKYLTLLYGDYMTPPPPDKRVATHENIRYYVNLREHVTIDIAKKRLSKGECLVY